MKHSDLSDLEFCVRDVIRRSALANQFKDVALEADRDENGDDFLRVIVELNGFEGIKHETMESLITSIETAINNIDERFPSVRFADAA